ncbi:hypothetical protein SCA6_013187 [Theobroma cacao]
MSSSARLSDLKSIINELLEVKSATIFGPDETHWGELMLENENSEGKESHLSKIIAANIYMILEEISISRIEDMWWK